MRTTERAGTPPPSSFDSVVLAAVVVECQDLVGSRVQRIHQAGPDGLALVLRRPGHLRTLVASAHARWSRVHLAQDIPQSDAAPFAQLARGRLERATLRSIASPPFERIVTCSFDTLEGALDLFIEIMGRHSNLILCAGGVIVGALKSVRADQSRVREILPGRPYMPPPQPRPLPTTITVEGLSAPGAGPAWRTIIDTVAGIGPALAHEICARVGIDPGQPLGPEDASAVLAALRDVADTVSTRRFAPVLYRRADGEAVAYGAFPMQIYRTLRAEPASMSAAVEATIALAADRARLEAARSALASTVVRAADRARRALDAVSQGMKEAGEAHRVREQGELILAYLPKVTPGATVLEVPGFDGLPTRIALDPTRSGVENAQVYFRRYAKAQAALKRLPARQAGLETERAYLEGAATAITQAESEDDLWELEQDLAAEGLRRRSRRVARPRPVAAGRVFEIADGCRVMVGRSARENNHLTFAVARPDDLWLHARGMPGAHVILTGPSGPPTEEAIDAAARVAAYYSAGRDAASVPVDVTRRRFVRRQRGARPGQVHYTNERTIMVAPGRPVAPSRRSP